MGYIGSIILRVPGDTRSGADTTLVIRLIRHSSGMALVPGKNYPKIRVVSL